MRSSIARFLVVVAAFAVLGTACSSDDPLADPPNDTVPVRNDDGQVVIDIDGNEVVLTSGLSGFSDCDALLDHLRTEGAAQVGPYGFGSGHWFGPAGFREADAAVDDAGDDDAAGDSGSTESVATTSAQVEGVDFSGTNVQELGVDEADAIKTDGERIFVLAAGQLIVVDVTERAVVGTLDIDPGWNPQLLLDGDDLLLITNEWVPATELGRNGATTSVDDSSDAVEEIGVDAEESFAADVAEPYFEETSVTRISRITVNDSRPELTESIIVEGEYVSSRAVGGVARVIIRSYPEQNFPFVYPSNTEGESIAEIANQEAVRQSTLDDWLPQMVQFDSDGSVVADGYAAACDQFHAPTEFAGFGVLSVLSVPVAGAIDPSRTTAVLAPGNTVYASTDAIFIATQTWVDFGLFETDAEREQAWNARQTSIHRFGLSADSAAYTASGSVAGDIRNQFSMSEYEGHLRVVTTTGDPWDESSESHLRVLRESDGELIEVGSVGNMGRGEAVQSVRMVGDVGYVVTFRQIDPFYTLDLTDPEDPRVVGELKIPGFSSYLHPIGNGRVLGVGSDGTDDGQITGSKVSIFDVTDPANPQEVAIWSAPGGWNEVGWEHRSFLWWEPEQLAVVPLSIWDNGDHWAGAVVLRVDGTTITEVGRIDHVDNDTVRGATECDVVGPADLPNGENEGEFETEFEWMVYDDYSRVIVCDPGEARSVSGFECYEDDWVREDAERAGFQVDADETLAVCWSNENNVPHIARTMVLNRDELWSLSTPWGHIDGNQSARLQVNDLDSLERLDAVALP